MESINWGEHVVASVCGGAIIALLTGLFAIGPILIGEIRHGYPLPWLIQPAYFPQFLQWKVDPLNLLADVLVWSAISGVIVFAAFSAHITKSWKGILVVVAGGVVATVITSLFPNTAQPLFGALHYGFPYPWIIQPEAPYLFYPPIQVNFKDLAGDMAGWTLVTGFLALPVPLIREKRRISGASDSSSRV